MILLCIYAGADYICHVTIIHFAQKIFGEVATESFLIYIYGFMQHHMIGVTVCLYAIMYFIVYIRTSTVYVLVTYNSRYASVNIKA